MGRKVLIVDDSAVMRKIIARSLAQAGFAFEQVVEASDGYEGLHRVGQGGVDLIISDVNMPNMDGLEFIRTLSEMNLQPPIPVIMVTTEGSESKIQEALTYGARGYIAKPFTPDQLKEKIGKVLAT